MFGLFKRRKKQKVNEEVKINKDLEVKEEEPLKEEVHEEPIKEETQKEPSKEVKEEQPKKRTRKPINHITKHKDGGWQVKKEGASRALKRFKTQKEAIEFAKNLEKTTETGYIIHKADGSTRKKTY